MVNGDAILNTLREKMEVSRQEFEKINIEIDEVVNRYNTAITKLENEGKEKLEALRNRREQVRGEYTSAYNIYEQYKVISEDSKDESVKDDTKPKLDKEAKPEVVKEIKSKSDVGRPKKDADKKSKSSDLTPEEVNKLKNELAKSNTKKDSNVKNEDIPDYLADQYNT